jgi:hypothetical protein
MHIFMCLLALHKFKLNIDACVVYASCKLIDDMKTSMHRMIARHLVCFSINTSTLHLMLI